MHTIIVNVNIVIEFDMVFQNIIFHSISHLVTISHDLMKCVVALSICWVSHSVPSTDLSFNLFFLWTKGYTLLHKHL